MFVYAPSGVLVLFCVALSLAWAGAAFEFTLLSVSTIPVGCTLTASAWNRLCISCLRWFGMLLTLEIKAS